MTFFARSTEVLRGAAGALKAPWRGLDASTPDSTFRLTRYFSLTSLAGVLIILAVLLFFYRHFAFRALEVHEARDNESLTRVFANTIWNNYARFVQGASALPRTELPRRPEVAAMRRDVLRQMNGLNVVKVKVYSLDGLTVFSTDPGQIGEDRSANAGFLKARAGGIASDITFRDRFDAFEGVINDRNLVSSYVPIRATQEAPVEGVMEVYSDVTEYVAGLRRTTWEIVTVILGSLLLLYLFLYAIVRRAERIIGAQAVEVRAAHERLLRHQALHDTLTGLPNRAGFSERLDGMIKFARRAGEKCAVLHLDLDAFNIINDSLGQVTGDELLKEVGNRLHDCLREADITARIGGDEFIVALSAIAGPRGIERIVNAAERLRGAVSDRVLAAGTHDVQVTASIGIAIYPDDGADVVELTRSADVALNHAKKLGRNSYQFHTPGMNAKALDMLLMERDLRRALEEGQFLLHYQPKADIGTGRIIGVEALLRWRHPERGLVSPAHFIPVAEDRGLIEPIGLWVLQEACRQNREWQEAGLPPMSVSVNLSAVQFKNEHLAKDVTRIVGDSNLAPGHLELELTESVVMRDAVRTIAAMHEFKEAGIQLSLDDFGTGYSSLSQLKRLPLDRLKIDQSFMRGLPDDRNDLAITTAIIAMGQALRLKVIAEGIETDGQLQVVRSLGCDEMQGYLLARPLPGAELAAFLRARKAV